MKISDVRVDPSKIEAGAWIGDVPEFETVRFKVRGLGCSEQQKLQRRLFEGIPRSRRPKGRISDDDQERILNRCLVEVILLDWDGLQNDDDSPLPYSREMAEKFITDPAYRKLREAVIWAADAVANDRAEGVAVATGNSALTSVGSSNGAVASSI